MKTSGLRRRATLALGGFAVALLAGCGGDTPSTPAAPAAPEPPGVTAVSLLTLPSDPGGWIVSETIRVQATFSEPVSVAGSPRLALGIGSEIRFAAFHEGGSSGAFVAFAYHIAADDRDEDGVSIGADALELNGGTIRNGAGLDANLDLGSHVIENSAPHVVVGASPQQECTDERDRALAYSWGHAELVHEWNPDRPIRFRVDAGPITEGGLRIGRPNFLEEEVLQPLRDMARRLEERLGYPIMEPDAPPSDASRTVTVHWRDRVWSPGWGEPDCPGHVGSPWNAQGTPPAVVLNRYLFDPAITCAGYRRDRDSETIIHELAHVFGMGHAEGASNYVPEDLAMSERLTRIVGGDSDYFLPIEDLENIGCVFPHPDFPRGN